jgi:hypothetical protein
MIVTFAKSSAAVVVAVAALVATPAASARASSSEDRIPIKQGLKGTQSVRRTVPGFPNLYEAFKDKNCTGALCTIQLDPVPDGALLEATNISCLAGVPLVDPPEVQLIFGLFYPPLTRESVKGWFAAKSKHFWVINETIRAFFPSRSRPAVQVSYGFGGATTVNVSCTLSGTLLQ